MERYQRGKIYRIVCNITGKTYIGSTCKRLLSERLTGHKKQYRDWLNGKSNYTSSFDILEGGNFYIELLELVPCNSKDELLTRERYHINTTDCTNKMKNLVRTQKDKEDYHLIYNKEYYDNNKDYHKKYYEDNKEKIKSQYNNRTEQRKEYQKQWREKNPNYQSQRNEKIKKLKQIIIT